MVPGLLAVALADDLAYLSVSPPGKWGWLGSELRCGPQGHHRRSHHWAWQNRHVPMGERCWDRQAPLQVHGTPRECRVQGWRAQLWTSTLPRGNFEVLSRQPCKPVPGGSTHPQPRLPDLPWHSPASGPLYTCLTYSLTSVVSWPHSPSQHRGPTF